MTLLARIGLVSTVLAAFAAPAAANGLPTSTASASVVVFGHAPGAISTGAGTIVAASRSTVRVITADHVTAFSNLTIRLGDGSLAPAHVVAHFPGRDLAVIEAPITPAQAPFTTPAALGAPRSNEAVSVMGGTLGAGPALEAAATVRVGANLPDGPANGRYALACTTCHQGDSGGGIFDASGALVGVYVGYFEMDDNSRVSVAEALPAAALDIARTGVPTATTQALVAAATVSR